MAISPRTHDQAAWYLAGIIDGEGHVSSNLKNRYIQIVNTDPTIILAIQDALDLLNVAYITYDANVREGHSEGWRIQIGRRDEIEKLAKVIYLQSDKKRIALQAIIDSPRKSWCDGDPRIDEIKKLYWIDGLSQRAIGKYFGTSKGRIGNIMHRHGIPTRDRLDAVRGALTKC